VKISVLLPTLHPGRARAAIDAMRQALAGIESEFVVVCPAEIGGEGVVWVHEASPRGSVAASSAAFAAARGDFAVMAGDDVRFDESAFAEAIAAFAAPERPFPMALAYPSVLSGIATHFAMYGRLCPSFFAIARADAEAAGGFLDPRYRLAFADPDLGLRIWAKGGQVRAASARVRHDLGAASAGKSRATDADFAAFRARWAAEFDPAWGEALGGLQHLIAVAGSALLGPDPGTIAVDGHAGIRDIRILHALTISAMVHNASLPDEVLRAGFDYLRWIAGLGVNPSQVEIGGGRARVVVALPGLFGG
jgi:hypothetical protein